MDVTEEKTIVFTDDCQVPLQDGRYQVCMEQKTELWPGLQSQPLNFRVEGPRFDLGEEGVHSCYPPDQTTGGYGSVLPHVVLNRRTLPWERRETDRESGERKIPWMCLLLLWEEEIPQLRQEEAENALNPEKAKEVYIPGLSLDQNEKSQICRFIDLEKELFLKIAPRIRELPWLCHGGYAGKDGLAAVSDPEKEPEDKGWYSTVMANRFPESSEAGAKNHVYLVSLEGYGDYEEALPKAAQSHVRLFVLHDWEFISHKSQYGFGHRVQELSVGYLTMPLEKASENLAPILQNGYVPMEHRLRNGERTVSFYRSCCVPKPWKQAEVEADTADGLYGYDPRWGVLDVSYGAAWQAGRLAALNRKTVAEQIMERRRKDLMEVRRRVHRQLLQENVQGLLPDGNETVGHSVLTLLEDIGGRLL